jgi:hypothetical protein
MLLEVRFWNWALSKEKYVPMILFFQLVTLFKKYKLREENQLISLVMELLLCVVKVMILQES